MQRFFCPLLIMTILAGCARQAVQSPTLPPPPPSSAPSASAPAPPQPPAAPPRQPPAVPSQSLAAGPFFTETGLASFYGRAHAGKRTASGGNFDHQAYTAAHRTLPFGTLVRVTNLANGRMVTLEITDRGPAIKTRIIDVSLAAARALAMQQKGVTRVRLEAFQADQASAR